jgi:hypothetical protein
VRGTSKEDSERSLAEARTMVNEIKQLSVLKKRLAKLKQSGASPQNPNAYAEILNDLKALRVKPPPPALAPAATSKPQNPLVMIEKQFQQLNKLIKERTQTLSKQIKAKTKETNRQREIAGYFSKIQTDSKALRGKVDVNSCIL